MSFLSIEKSKLEAKIKEVFSEPPTLETEHLYLKKIVDEYAEDMFEYAKDPLVTKYLTWSSHSSLKETQRHIKLLQKKYKTGFYNDWGIVDKETGKMIGTCGFTSFDEQKNMAEIGYVLSKEYWGRGLAAEAAKRVMQFGKEVFGLTSFCAKCIEGNNASIAVMKKCGMTELDGVYKNSMFIKGEYKTIVIYRTPKTE